MDAGFLARLTQSQFLSCPGDEARSPDAVVLTLRASMENDMTVSTRSPTEYGDFARGNGNGAPPWNPGQCEPPPPPRRRIKRFQGRLVWTELKYWTTVLLSKVGLGAVVVNWEAKGVRNAME